MTIFQVEQEAVNDIIDSNILKDLSHPERKIIKETDKAYLIDTNLNIYNSDTNQEVAIKKDMFNKFMNMCRMKGYGVVMIKKNPTV